MRGGNYQKGDWVPGTRRVPRKNFFRLEFFGIFITGMMKPCPTPFLILLATPLLWGETYVGKCVGVTDGDAISIMHGGRPVKIPLEDIDCPELGQALVGHKSQLFS